MSEETCQQRLKKSASKNDSCLRILNLPFMNFSSMLFSDGFASIASFFGCRTKGLRTQIKRGSRESTIDMHLSGTTGSQSQSTHSSPSPTSMVAPSSAASGSTAPNLSARSRRFRSSSVSSLAAVARPYRAARRSFLAFSSCQRK